ncbi:hypothetical protein [Bacillus sp. FJAT-47783]|uniref:hypothetical protein n=1 Tax=Bacillus sp. FJAT-47783 TaxID=2922712 RepID=UPI001FACA84A|nr:hypothetical protein [Bacillus sp. FJAT-47783]
MALTKQSKLILQPLTIRQDRKSYIVEDVTSHEYYEMPKICVDAIGMIQEERTLGEVEVELKKQYPNENVDLIDFANQLIELELVKKIDGEEISYQKPKNQNSGFSWISPTFARLFFSKWSMYGFGLLFIINIFLFLWKPALIPSYRDVFVFDVMSFNILAWLFITFCTVMVHELGHVLAARAYDLPTTMGISHRLFFVVFETDLSRSWSLSPKERNVLYLGGMCFDQVVLFGALIGQLLFPNANLLAVIVLDVFIRTVFQCCLYMKTDFYYVLENVTGCYNLMENGKQFLSRWLPFIRQQDQTETFTGEEKMVKMYALFYIAGVSITTLFFFVFYIPQTVYALKRTVPHLLSMEFTIYFWDALLFVGQLIAMTSLLLYSWGKKYKHLHSKKEKVA